MEPTESPAPLCKRFPDNHRTVSRIACYMRTVTKYVRRFTVGCLVLSVAGISYAQRGALGSTHTMNAAGNAPESRFHFDPASQPIGEAGNQTGTLSGPSRYSRFNPFLNPKDTAKSPFLVIPDENNKLIPGTDFLTQIDQHSHAGWDVPVLTDLFGIRASYRGMSTSFADGNRSKSDPGLYLRF